jgi:hypothetical protein
MAGQQRQINLLIQIAHVRLRDTDMGGQFSVNLAVRGVELIPQPAKAHQHIIAIGGARHGKVLPLC